MPSDLASFIQLINIVLDATAIDINWMARQLLQRTRAPILAIPDHPRFGNRVFVAETQ
jgi:hypothetical protein